MEDSLPVDTFLDFIKMEYCREYGQ